MSRTTPRHGFTLIERLACPPKRSTGREGDVRSAFTLIELLVVVAIIGILIALVIPGLRAAVNRGRAIECLSNMRQIGLATHGFRADNDGRMPFLWRQRGFGAPWTYDEATFVVQHPDHLWWPDTLRLGNYAPSSRIFDCPSVTAYAGRAAGGARSANNALGIGLNHMEFSNLQFAPGVESSPRLFISDRHVRRPRDGVMFADAAAIQNPDEPDADRWIEDTGVTVWLGTGNAYFRVPSNPNYHLGDSRSVPRHSGRVQVVFFDGHGRAMSNRDIGYHLPRTHPGALWARDSRTATVPMR